MKLELKHIAPYLPYGLKILVENEVQEIDSLPDFAHISYFDEEYSESVDLHIESITLVLRNLSYLTKEIEVNGEKFVPIDIIYNLWYDSNLGQFSKTIILQKIKLFSNKMPYFIVEKLLEWHFDIFSLIEQGLAVDINTLND